MHVHTSKAHQSQIILYLAHLLSRFGQTSIHLLTARGWRHEKMRRTRQIKVSQSRRFLTCSPICKRDLQLPSTCLPSTQERRKSLLQAYIDWDRSTNAIMFCSFWNARLALRTCVFIMPSRAHSIPFLFCKRSRTGTPATRSFTVVQENLVRNCDTWSQNSTYNASRHKVSMASLLRCWKTSSCSSKRCEIERQLRLLYVFCRQQWQSEP